MSNIQFQVDKWEDMSYLPKRCFRAEKKQEERISIEECLDEIIRKTDNEPVDLSTRITAKSSYERKYTYGHVTATGNQSCEIMHTPTCTAVHMNAPYSNAGTSVAHEHWPKKKYTAIFEQMSDTMSHISSADNPAKHTTKTTDMRLGTTSEKHNDNTTPQPRKQQNKHTILKAMLNASLDTDLSAWAKHKPGEPIVESTGQSDIHEETRLPSPTLSELLRGGSHSTQSTERRSKRKYSEIDQDGVIQDNNNVLGYEVLGTLGVTNSKKRYFISMAEIHRRISKPENMSENGLCCFLKRRRGSLPLGCPKPKPRQRGDITPFSSLCEAELGDLILAYKECLTKYVEGQKIIEGVEKSTIPHLIQALRKILLNVHLACRPSSDFQRMTHTFGAKMLESVLTYLMSCLNQYTFQEQTEQ